MIATSILILAAHVLACTARSIVRPPSPVLRNTSTNGNSDPGGSKCSLVGSFVIPHGGITLNPSMDFTQEPGYTRGAEKSIQKLHEGMKTAANDLVKLRPDLIILSTPHGFYLEDNFVTLIGPGVS